jgi:hypothetical protein
MAIPETQRNLLHWSIVVLATFSPWGLGLALNWWIGLVALGSLCWLYDRLFVPPGHLCMGLPFMFPLTSGLAYLGWGLLMLLGWFRSFLG